MDAKEGLFPRSSELVGIQCQFQLDHSRNLSPDHEGGQAARLCHGLGSAAHVQERLYQQYLTGLRLPPVLWQEWALPALRPPGPRPKTTPGGPPGSRKSDPLLFLPKGISRRK
ncbi:hypothetical protein ACA910_021650 [Epithemia clementina (nom. ined.)]